MVMLLVTSSSPLMSVTTPVTVKLIVSPFATLASAVRREPAPLSAVLVTVLVAAWEFRLHIRLRARARNAPRRNDGAKQGRKLVGGMVFIWLNGSKQNNSKADDPVPIWSTFVENTAPLLALIPRPTTQPVGVTVPFVP